MRRTALDERVDGRGSASTGTGTGTDTGAAGGIDSRAFGRQRREMQSLERLQNRRWLQRLLRRMRTCVWRRRERGRVVRL